MPLSFVARVGMLTRCRRGYLQEVRMQGINMGRVIIGGIAAGVVYDIIETVANLYLFAEQGQEMMERLDMAEPSGAQIGMFMAMGLATGIMIAWTYAAIRPRMGEGAMTAICAGLVAWTFLALFLNVSWMIIGLLPVGFGITITVFQAVEFSAVGYVAGMLYKEE